MTVVQHGGLSDDEYFKENSMSFDMTEARKVLHEAFPAAFALLPAAMDTPKARAQLLATAGQESLFKFRVQRSKGAGGALVPGPARGLYQFESGRLSGTVEVMTNLKTEDFARSVCEARGVPFEAKAIWSAFETDDVLATAFARLLYWPSSRPMPSEGEHAAGWSLYLSRWHPGAPHEDKWQSNFESAWQLVNEDA